MTMKLEKFVKLLAVTVISCSIVVGCKSPQRLTPLPGRGQTSSVGGEGPGRAPQREVVGLGGPGGEDEVLGLGPDQGGQARAGLLNRPVRLCREGVRPAGGIAEVLREVRQHGRHHRRVDRRGRVVVEVYPSHVLQVSGKTPCRGSRGL